MNKFLRNSAEWTNARKTFLANPEEYKGTTPYEGYKLWLRQFGAVETIGSINIRNDADAVAFKLRFGYNKA